MSKSTNPFAKSSPAGKAKPTTKRPSSGGQIVYYDLETIPDGRRFPMPEPPEYNPELYAADVMRMSVADVKTLCESLTSEQLNKAAQIELQKEKCRKGALDAVHGEIDKRNSAIDTWCKEGSVNPLTCRIVAAAWAVDDADPVAMFADSYDAERELLGELWSVLSAAKTRCGYNILNFDDSVLGIRSLLLGVDPLFQIDRNRYRNDQAIDLMHLVSPGKMYRAKDVAEWLEIDVPADGVDGSDVYELFESNEDKQIIDYVTSDVVIEREIHRKLQRVFC